MQKVNREVKFAEQIEIVPIGDCHLGSPGSRVDKLKNMVDYIKNTPNCYTILMGDIFDCILGDDRRLDLTEFSRAFLDILDDATSIFEPIKDKIITALLGNHEHTLKKKGVGDPIFHLCNRLGVKYGGYSCFIKLKAAPKTHRRSLIIYAHHGFFSGRQRGSKVNNLERLAQHYSADVYLAGHSHDLFATRSTRIDWGGERDVLFGNTGTFLETATEGTATYSERAGYPPQKLGCLKIKWYPKTNKTFATE
jgi:predicted phosphodiesterase